MKNIILILIMFAGMMQAGTIRSEEHEYFTRGFRIVVNARINDSAGVYEARVYFKRHKVKDYQLYSLMECKENRCHTELPRTSPQLQWLDYVIVYQNSAGVSFKSETYTMEKRDMLELPSWQSLNNHDLTLYSEYTKGPKWIDGFTDTIEIQKGLEEEALGVTVGLYPMELIRPTVEIPCPQCAECKE